MKKGCSLPVQDLWCPCRILSATRVAQEPTSSTETGREGSVSDRWAGEEAPLPLPPLGSCHFCVGKGGVGKRERKAGRGTPAAPPPEENTDPRHTWDLWSLPPLPHSSQFFLLNTITEAIFKCCISEFDKVSATHNSSTCLMCLSSWHLDTQHLNLSCFLNSLHIQISCSSQDLWLLAQSPSIPFSNPLLLPYSRPSPSHLSYSNSSLTKHLLSGSSYTVLHKAWSFENCKFGSAKTWIKRIDNSSPLL